MRALLLVLAAAAAAPALLVLRSACHRPLLYDERRLRDYAATAGTTSLPPFQILSHNETCGPEWQSSVSRMALGAASAGGAVVVSGQAGRACGVLRAAARVLPQRVPRACAAPYALGAALLLVLTRLHWSRALLPPPAASDCADTLQEAILVLVNAGLEVRVAPLSVEELARKPHVVILCASDRSWDVRAPVLQAGGAAGSGAAALVVYASEHATPDVGAKSAESFQMSNINLAVRSSPYIDERENSSYNTRFPFFTKFLGLLSNPSVDKKSLSQTPLVAQTKNLVMSETQTRNTRELTENKKVIPPKHLTKETAIIQLQKQDNYSQNVIFFEQEKNKSSTRLRPRRNTTLPAEDTQPTQHEAIQRFQAVSLKLHKLFKIKLFLICDDEFNLKRTLFTEENIYDDIIKSLQREMEATRTHVDINREEVVLYESQLDNLANSWKYLATLSAAWSKPLGVGERWETSAEVVNASQEFETWNPVEWAHEELETGSVSAGQLLQVVLGAAGTLALVGAVAGGVQHTAVRRRRRRRRADVVLAASDVTFPPDERRRLGEGMETMLSCWLQQLHEFGGPELERPDLLKQPSPAPPAPSAPSSTCSVNRVPLDRRIRYKGDAVQVRYLPTEGALEMRRRATDILLVLQALRHENLNPFIGCLCEPRPALVFDYCGRGSLEDVLVADDIKLDWTFRLSLLTDLVKGMRYLHGSCLRVHGRLTSRSVCVDSRWVLRVTDYGLPSFYHAAGIAEPDRTPRELLWSAPELIREDRGKGRGSQPGDVFSFAIIMQEVIVRGEPYCMLSISPEEIIEKLLSPPPLIRPSVSMGAAPPEAVSVMRQCWSEAPELRPDFSSLHDIFRHLHRGRKINIVDSMFEMLEKYSNNLEELIKERTEQLDMEQKKTEQLLNRMLPRSVAERLLLGSRVEPEEFEEVTVYFSDIVGFTSLAARSTPVQVVDLLNDLYTTFDAAIEQYSVYKVETIGDAYMVVGGLPTRAATHAESVATMALHLLHLAGRFRVRHRPGSPLYLRSGVHTGPCCAGVVGLTMPRYCLFGDTVNTASRMESTGAAWRIQVSAATAARLQAAGGYRLRSRGLTMVKGKGAMHTYWLLGKDGFDKLLPTPPPLESEEVLFESEGENESETSTTTAAAIVEEKSCSAQLATKAWQRSGAVSADCSPPPRAQSHCSVYVPTDHSTPYSRYRCMPSGGRVLQRQWSLERGDVLAAAAGARSPPAPAAAAPPPAPSEPLALRAPPPPPAHHKYRTRPDTARPSSLDEGLLQTD